MLRENFMSVGTTSACAENTVGASWRPRPSWNYLRVRGEYVVICFTSGPGMELPPRARRIQEHLPQALLALGTTSACAENTFWGDGFTACEQNYLRVRGEYFHG